VYDECLGLEIRSEQYNSR